MVSGSNETFDVLEDRTVIVTGATGSFGRHIARELVQNSKVRRLLLFSRDEERQRLLRLMLEPFIADGAAVEYVLGDVRDRDSLFRVVSDADVIINAAALKQVPACELNALEAIRTNVLGMQNILDAAAERGVSEVLTISTDKAVQPINTMGITKALQERVVQSHSLRWSSPTVKVVRYGNVLGSTGSVLPVFVSQLKKTGRITLTHPDMTRFLLSLDDAMHLVSRALDGSEGTGTVYVRKSPALTMQEFATSVLRVFSDGDPSRIDVVGPRPGDKFHEVLVSEDEMRRAQLSDDYYVISPLVPTDVAGEVAGGNEPLEPFSSDRARLLTGDDVDELLQEWASGSPFLHEH